MVSSKSLNAVSGLLFGLFLVMHLLSHYAITLAGYDEANEILQGLRKVYRNPIFEAVLFGSLITHMYSNVCLYMSRNRIASTVKEDDNKKKKVGTMELNAHRIAGYFLSLSIFGHVTATRLVPMFILDDSSEYDYSFAIDAANHLPGPFFFVYLALLGITGGWHLIYGSWSAIATLRGGSIRGKSMPMVLKVAAMVNHLIIVLSIMVLGGVFYKIDVSSKSHLHSQVSSALGL